MAWASSIGGAIAACEDTPSSSAPDAGSSVLSPALDAATASHADGSSSVSPDAGSPDAATSDSGSSDAEVEASTDADADASIQGCHGGTFTFDDDFTQGLRSQYWSIAYSPAADAGGGVFTYADDAGALRLSKVGQNTGGLKNIQSVLDLVAAGGPVLDDFTINVDFRDAVLGATQIDQIELHTVFGDGTIFFNVYSNEGGLEFHVWDGAFRGRVGTTADHGKLRITRSGTTLSAYATTADDAGTDVETLIYAVDRGAKPELKLVRFVAQLFNTNNNIAVTFDNFHIEGSCAP
jgi:hypothetical protein